MPFLACAATATTGRPPTRVDAIEKKPNSESPSKTGTCTGAPPALRLTSYRPLSVASISAEPSSRRVHAKSATLSVSKRDGSPHDSPALLETRTIDAVGDPS